MDGVQSPRHGLKLLVLLYSSMLINVFFFAYHFLPPAPPSPLGGRELSWALQAAREAEAVAATDCSGHGRAFLDSVPRADGRPRCKCNKCFGGHDCSVRTPNCSSDADSGNPLFLEPYWMRHAAASAVVVSGWHRMSYTIGFTTDDNFNSVELKNHIRRLHEAVGNAVVGDKFLVVGTGSTQLLNALVYALSPDKAAPPASVVATAPYWNRYKTQTELMDGREYKWAGTTALWANSSRNSTKNFIEFVTSPNNPDGLLYKPVLGGSSAIFDHAYYWPHFTHIPAPADEDVMIFTMSKLSGHAGSRLGWALIRDEKVAKKAYQYVGQNSMGTSHDTQLRMLKIIKVILRNLKEKEDIFAFGYDTMRARWRKLNAVASQSRRISLQKIPPQYCTYFKKIRDPSPAYAWVKCEREEDTDCYQALLKANIISRAFVQGVVSRRYTRLSLIKSQDDFDALLEKMTDLINGEEYSISGSSSI